MIPRRVQCASNRILSASAWFRPPSDAELADLYLVGAGTYPGAGVGVIGSASDCRLMTREFDDERGVVTPPRPSRSARKLPAAAKLFPDAAALMYAVPPLRRHRRRPGIGLGGRHRSSEAAMQLAAAGRSKPAYTAKR
jgi:hypothetical protein